MGNSNNAGKVLGAVFLGAAIGGVLGILFAPEKGSDTRKKISDKSHDLTESMKEKFGEIVEKFKKDAEKVKGRVNEYADNGMDAIESLKTN